MKTEIDVPTYSEEGLPFVWEAAYTIKAQIQGNRVIIQADTGGLISIARHLLTLAQSTVPSGYHFHLDDSNGLEDGSCELVIEKTHR